MYGWIERMERDLDIESIAENRRDRDGMIERAQKLVKKVETLFIS